MPYSPWEFDIISERHIVDPGNEELCPNRPKVRLLETERQFDDTIESTLDQFNLHKIRDLDDRTPANAHNIQRILCLTLPNTRLCAYHLGRGMAAAALEVIGWPCDQYWPLVPAMSTLIERITIGAQPSYLSDAQEWFKEFMSAEANGGVQGFIALGGKTEPVSK
ncbi:hypothetical protein [Streptomyces nigrescens]|uniref:hypothetical protein n=1 Tax=Streptomyces nigrescens TaxID=1920 RepID=UPI0036FF30B8